MDETDTFAVVRNPYDRWISEYYCDYWGYKGDDVNDPRAMNKWIQTNITLPIIQYGHTMPQHLYIFDERGNQVITHVLKYETLAKDFPALVKQYGMGRIRLPPKNVSQAKRNRLSKRNLSRTSIRLINLHSQQDFEKFGYRMVKHPGDF
jgi:hypothetical protein